MMTRVFVALTVSLICHAQGQQQILAMHTPITVTAPATYIPQLMLANLEKSFDMRLESLDANDPLDILGGTRGLYVEGFGTVFTTELSLIVTPGISPFRPTISDELKTKVHQRKIANLPQVEDLMKALMIISARTLGPLPDNQKIMYAVRLRYLPYEDTAGLPAQIMMTADKKSALLGDIKTKVE